VARVKVELPARLPFSTEIPVHISDINYGGHLGNDALLALLQEGRLRYLTSGGMSELDAGGCGIIMVDAMIQYRAEVFYGDVLVVEIGVGDPGLSGCDILYRVTRKQDGQEVARAKTGIAFFDYAQRKVVPMPERFRKFTEKS
jgi:4-hydroxybenzoyl-CoA thioesterase